MQAKSAAERMREFRQRKAQHENLKYTEVYVPTNALDDARGLMVRDTMPLREVLTRAVVRGLRAEEGKVEPFEALKTVFELLGQELSYAIDDEAGIMGQSDGIKVLGVLLREALDARQAERATPKPKRGRPAKSKPSV